MLKDIINFVRSRTDLNREGALREINYAWKEIWNSDDLPNSVFEISVRPLDDNARISLPWYVGEIRGAKQNTYGRERIVLNTPRPWYQDQQYYQSIFLWRLLGTTPLKQSITNASTLTLKFNDPVIETTTATLLGPDDNGTQVREQVVFKVGESEKETVKRFTDLDTAAKDILTPSDLRLIDANGIDIGFIPNSAFEAKNFVVQITDKAFKVCNFCRCFDILYKKACPYLFYDETPVPFEEVIMTKTMEWIMLPKEDQDKKAQLFSDKSRTLLTAYNHNEVSIEKRLDIGRSGFETQYRWKI